MANDLIEISDEVRAKGVIELMFTGKTKKAACEETGVAVRTFDRWVASNPELIQQIRTQTQASFTEFLDEINEARRANLQSMLTYSAYLRKTLIVDSILDFDESRKAFAALVKLEGQLAKTMALILPETKQAIAPPSEIDDSRAMELLSNLRGANLREVTITKTIEVKSKPIDDQQVEEGSVRPE